MRQRRLVHSQSSVTFTRQLLWELVCRSIILQQFSNWTKTFAVTQSLYRYIYNRITFKNMHTYSFTIEYIGIRTLQKIFVYGFLCLAVTHTVSFHHYVCMLMSDFWSFWKAYIMTVSINEKLLILLHVMWIQN